MTVRAGPHQIEDDGRRPLRFCKVQCTEAILNPHSRKSSGAKCRPVRITQLWIVFDDEDVVFPRSQWQGPGYRGQDIHKSVRLERTVVAKRNHGGSWRPPTSESG